MRAGAWSRGAALLLCATVLLAGCAKPAGVDGDLTNDWPAMGEAKAAVPEVGVCYDQAYDSTWSGPFDTVDCAGDHHVETTYVGEFTGADADASAPPSAGSDGRRSAFQACMTNTNDYLGGDFHAALVFLGLVLPSANAWKGGARWFRCDVVHYKDPDGDDEVTTGSVRDGLTGAAALAFPCVNTTEQDSAHIGDISAPVSCAGAHSAEFAGVFTAPDAPWEPDAGKRSDIARLGCWEKVYSFVGSRHPSQLIGLIWGNFQQDRWDLGDRGVRCYAYAETSGHKFGESVKGIGARDPKQG
jgi:Septum formation